MRPDRHAIVLAQRRGRRGRVPVRIADCLVFSGACVLGFAQTGQVGRDTDTTTAIAGSPLGKHADADLQWLLLVPHRNG